jgi:peptide/nickel transport system permease protein
MTLRFLGRRLWQAVPVILIVSIGVFFLLEIAEGDAVDAYLAATGVGDVSLAVQLREQYGLTDNLGTRFLTYMTRLVTFDLGYSVAFSKPVTEVIGSRLPVTLMLMITSILVSGSLGVLLGGIASWRRGRPTDVGITITALALNAMPGFWLGLLAIILFVVKLRWLPLGGIGTIGADLSGFAAMLDTARHLVLPVTTLALTYLALYVRLMRAAMVEAADSGWVLAARARGLGERQILLRHMARPALLPVVTMLGLKAGQMLGGSVVIETVFAVPGLGRLSYEAVTQRDLPLLAAILLAGTLVVVIVNILVDLLYRWLDPRIADAAEREARH